MAEADAAVLTEYRGLTVPELADLRAALRGSGTEYKVFKNTLARRAVADSGLDDVASMFEGPVAIAFVRGDAAAAAKALREFGRNHEALVVKGGLLGERIITPVEIEALAELPSRDVLLAQARGRVPGAAHQGGRPVPGVHPQLRLRREGPHRPARRRPRGSRAESRSPKPRRPRPKPRQPRPEAQAAAAEAPAAESESETPESEAPTGEQ